MIPARPKRNIDVGFDVDAHRAQTEEFIATVEGENAEIEARGLCLCHLSPKTRCPDVLEREARVAAYLATLPESERVKVEARKQKIAAWKAAGSPRGGALQAWLSSWSGDNDAANGRIGTPEGGETASPSPQFAKEVA